VRRTGSSRRQRTKRRSGDEPKLSGSRGGEASSAATWFGSFDAARLGIGGRTGREWFTKYSLSRALHTRPEEIQKWIDCGWLKSRSLPSAGMRAKIIYADDFCQFVKEHGHAAVSRRLTYDALWFVQNLV
jgi:hypothetical protein